jgi:hypothetical protein
MGPKLMNPAYLEEKAKLLDCYPACTRIFDSLRQLGYSQSPVCVMDTRAHCFVEIQA